MGKKMDSAIISVVDALIDLKKIDRTQEEEDISRDLVHQMDIVQERITYLQEAVVKDLITDNDQVGTDVEDKEMMSEDDSNEGQVAITIEANQNGFPIKNGGV